MINVSTVVYIKETGKDEHIRISNTLIAIANSKEGKSSDHGDSPYFSVFTIILS